MRNKPPGVAKQEGQIRKIGKAKVTVTCIEWTKIIEVCSYEDNAMKNLENPNLPITLSEKQLLSAEYVILSPWNLSGERYTPS